MMMISSTTLLLLLAASRWEFPAPNLVLVAGVAAALYDLAMHRRNNGSISAIDRVRVCLLLLLFTVTRVSESQRLSCAILAITVLLCVIDVVCFSLTLFRFVASSTQAVKRAMKVLSTKCVDVRDFVSSLKSYHFPNHFYVVAYVCYKFFPTYASDDSAVYKRLFVTYASIMSVCFDMVFGTLPFNLIVTKLVILAGLLFNPSSNHLKTELLTYLIHQFECSVELFHLVYALASLLRRAIEQKLKIFQHPTPITTVPIVVLDAPVPPPLLQLESRLPSSPQTLKTTMMIPTVPIKATIPYVPMTCPIPCVMINDEEYMEDFNDRQDLCSSPRGNAPTTNDIVPGAPIKSKNPSVPLSLSISCHILTSSVQSILRQSRYRQGPPPVDHLLLHQGDVNAEQVGGWEMAPSTCPIVSITADEMRFLELLAMDQDPDASPDAIDVISLNLSKNQTQDAVALPEMTKEQKLERVGQLPVDPTYDATIERTYTITFSIDVVFEDEWEDDDSLDDQPLTPPPSPTSGSFVNVQSPSACPPETVAPTIDVSKPIAAIPLSIIIPPAGTVTPTIFHCHEPVCNEKSEVESSFQHLHSSPSVAPTPWKDDSPNTQTLLQVLFEATTVPTANVPPSTCFSSEHHDSKQQQPLKTTTMTGDATNCVMRNISCAPIVRPKPRSLPCYEILSLIPKDNDFGKYFASQHFAPKHQTRNTKVSPKLYSAANDDQTAPHRSPTTSTPIDDSDDTIVAPIIFFPPAEIVAPTIIHCHAPVCDAMSEAESSCQHLDFAPTPLADDTPNTQTSLPHVKVELAVPCAVANLQATQSASQNTASAAVVPATASSITKVELAASGAVPNLHATQSASQSISPVAVVSTPIAPASVTDVELPVPCNVPNLKVTQSLSQSIAPVSVVSPPAAPSVADVELAVPCAVPIFQATQSPSQSIAPVAVVSPPAAPSITDVELPVPCDVPNLQATQSPSRPIAPVVVVSPPAAPSVTEGELAVPCAVPNLQATPAQSQSTTTLVAVVSPTAPSVVKVQLPPISCAISNVQATHSPACLPSTMGREQSPSTAATHASPTCHAVDLVNADTTWEDPNPEDVLADVLLPALSQPATCLACLDNTIGSVRDDLGCHTSLPTMLESLSPHQVHCNRGASLDRNQNANPERCQSSPHAPHATGPTTRSTMYKTRSGRAVRSPDRFVPGSVTLTPHTKPSIQTPTGAQLKQKVRPNRRIDTQHQHDFRGQPASRLTPVHSAYRTRSGRRVVPPSRLTVEEFRSRRH